MATPSHQDTLQVPAGAVIFRQGDPGREMFVIASGRVRLTLGAPGHEREVAMLGPGEFFGELALLSDEPRSATATAVEKTSLLAISRDVFTMMVQDDLEIVSGMMSVQGQRLSRTNQPIEELSQQIGHIRVAAHGLSRVAGVQSQLPATIDVELLAAELGLGVRAVEVIVADLARGGAGVLQNRHWRIQDQGQVVTLIEALCRYADSGSG